MIPPDIGKGFYHALSGLAPPVTGRSNRIPQLKVCGVARYKPSAVKPMGRYL